MSAQVPTIIDAPQPQRGAAVAKSIRCAHEVDMTADLRLHSRCGCTLACYPLVTLEACATALTACGMTLYAPARLAQAGMCWSGAIGQSSSRRLRWRLRVALYIDPDATVQVRRFVQLHARAHGALASRALLLCVSRCVRCLSSVLACVHVLHMPRH